MENKSFYKKLVSFALLLAVVFGGIWVWDNKWGIHDRWVSRSYQATVDSEEVRENLNLTPTGDLVFRASLTEVDGKDKFRTRCPVERFEEANVLGCYSARRIYVLKVDEPALKGVEEVTAAHELLHAQYERMEADQKSKLKTLLEDLRSKVSDEETIKIVESYKAQLGEGDELYNEMFAIYGTQLDEVGANLEEYYDDYFRQRSSIVTQYKNYSSAFRNIQSKIEAYDANLAKLKAEKDSLEAELQSESLQLSNKKSELEALEQSDSQEQYQSAVNSYNGAVEVYNAKVTRIRQVIEEYNSLVETRNQEALSARDLTDKLNANIEER